MTDAAAPPARPADSQLATWFDALSQVQADVDRLLEPLDEARLNWRPAPARWSVGECLDHLTVTGTAIASYLGPALERGWARGRTGVGPFELGRLGRWWVKQVGPAPVRTARAPAVFAPGSAFRKPELAARFQVMQRGLLRLVERAGGLDLRRIRARSPVTPLLRFNAATWFEATIAHECRHLDQARRVLAEPAFPR